MTKQWATAHGRTFEVKTLNSSVTPAPKRARAPKRFTKFPGIWEEVLGKAHASGSTYAVAVVLLYEGWKLKSTGREPIVKLTNDTLKPAHVGGRANGLR